MFAYDPQLSDLFNRPELAPLCDYVRRGAGPPLWPYRVRRIHPENKKFNDRDGRTYQSLHEYTLLLTDEQELYVIVSIMGWEYALNMGRPGLETYDWWLKAHSERSPLHLDHSIADLLSPSSSSSD